MFEIRLVCVGGMKEPFWEAACAEYAKRLTGRCRFITVEIAAQRLPDRPSPAQIAAGLHSEAARVLPQMEHAGFSCALCVEGRQMSSETLADTLDHLMSQGVSSAVFIIGSSFGLDETVKQRASLRFSMSPMTFPHGLARVMLMEQIYRAFEINAGSRYHK